MCTLSRGVFHANATALTQPLATPPLQSTAPRNSTLSGKGACSVEFIPGGEK